MISLVVFVTGSNRQILANLLPLVKATPPISMPDTNVMMAAMVDVFMYVCARNGLTTTKHLSHEMTVDRNCDTHADPAMPVDKTQINNTWYESIIYGAPSDEGKEQNSLQMEESNINKFSDE